MTEDNRHDLWVLAEHKLDHIRDEKFEEELASPQIATAYILAADPKGGLFLGLVDGDLVHYRDGKALTIPSKAHGNTQQIRDLLVDPDGSVWGTTLDELVRWKDGRRQNLTTRNGLPCADVFALVKDGSGSIWLYTRCGLVGIAQSELSRWWYHPDTVVEVTTLDETDDVRPGLASLKPQAVKTPDGRLWFVNGAILQMFDPVHFGGNSVPPQVHIEEIVADRQSYLPGPGLRLPPLTRDLEINYTAASFVAPQKVVFRYKLEGHDPTWQDPGTRRQAFYSDLLPGKYRFRVVARNNDGVWNEDGAAFDFVLDPAYYQTAWFRVLVAISALGMIWILYLLRMRQVTGQLQARLGERLVERERIARELHDTLLQGFQGLVLRFQAVMKQLPADGPARSMMEKALDRADEVLLEGRLRVRDLRSETSTVNELGDKLASFGTEMAEDWKVAFSLEIVGAPKTLDPIVCDEAYGIAREGLVNAFRHAKASKIEGEITYDHSRFRVRVRDDGVGMDQKVLSSGRPGRWGLSGMRERAQRIGGQLSIWSNSGAGTEIDLTVPGRIAYSGSHNGDRLQSIKQAARRMVGR